MSGAISDAELKKIKNVILKSVYNNKYHELWFFYSFLIMCVSFLILIASISFILNGPDPVAIGLLTAGISVIAGIPLLLWVTALPLLHEMRSTKQKVKIKTLQHAAFNGDLELIKKSVGSLKTIHDEVKLFEILPFSILGGKVDALELILDLWRLQYYDLRTFKDALGHDAHYYAQLSENPVMIDAVEKLMLYPQVAHFNTDESALSGPSCSYYSYSNGYARFWADYRKPAPAIDQSSSRCAYPSFIN